MSRGERSAGHGEHSAGYGERSAELSERSTELGEQPSISIVIPIHNDAETIDASVRSALDQTACDIEVIIVDDASTDDSADLVKRMAAADSRLKLIRRSQNGGAAIARRDGVMVARGAYALFLDGDDRLLPGACERLLACMQADPVDILQFEVSTSFVQMPDADVRKAMEDWLKPCIGTLQSEEILKRCFVAGGFSWTVWGKLFRTELCKRALREVDVKGVYRADDAYAMFFILCFADTYRGVEEGPFYEYRWGAGWEGMSSIDITRFRYLNTSKLFLDAIEGFLGDKTKTEELDDVRIATGVEALACLKRQLLGNIANQLCHRLPEAQRDEGCSIMIDTWSTDVVLDALLPEDAGQVMDPDAMEVASRIALLQARVAGAAGATGTAKTAPDTLKRVLMRDVDSYRALHEWTASLQQGKDWISRRYDELIDDNHRLASVIDVQRRAIEERSTVVSDTPAVSMVMPVYNTAPWLDTAIESVLGQTYGNFELICVDDGSTDGSLDILREYGRRDSRIRVFSQDHAGVSVARNAGIEQVRGGFIGFMDSDDELEPDMIAAAFTLAGAMDLDVVRFDARTVFDPPELEGDFHAFAGAYVRDVGCRQPVPGSRLMALMQDSGRYRPVVYLGLIRTSALVGNRIRFEPGLIHSDNPFTFEVMLLAQRAFHYPRALYVRRIRKGSIMTSADPDEDAPAYLRCHELMMDALRRRPVVPGDEPAAIAVIEHVAYLASMAEPSRVQAVDVQRLD